MSLEKIRDALEAALEAITPAIDTVHENEEYSPQPGVPYQETFLLVAMPNNSTLGDGFYQEQGVLQVNLKYQPGAGPADAVARAEMIRSAFKRGTSLILNGVTVQIDKTAAVSSGTVDGDRFKVVVRVPWHADIFN